MIENPKQTSEFDAVLGGQAPYSPGSVVLGGLEGVKRRLANTSITDRMGLLSEALKYGDAGLDLVIQALQDRDRQVKQTAYNLLRQRKELKARQAIHSWNPYQDFQCYYTWETTWLITSMVLSCDGTILAYSAIDDWTFKDSWLSVFDVKTKQHICRFNTGNGFYYAHPIAISPNEREIFWSTGDEITVGDLTTGKKFAPFTQMKTAVVKGFIPLLLALMDKELSVFRLKLLGCWTWQQDKQSTLSKRPQTQLSLLLLAQMEKSLSVS